MLFLESVKNDDYEMEYTSTILRNEGSIENSHCVSVKTCELITILHYTKIYFEEVKSIVRYCDLPKGFFAVIACLVSRGSDSPSLLTALTRNL